ncbi:MAG: tetratricopeptide repeat protein [Saprospiraceae bacterium]
MSFFQKNARIFILLVMAAILASACVATKSKNDNSVGWFKKRYQNLTTKYNYWFNADELLYLTQMQMNNAYRDNYNQLLPIFPYMAADAQPSKGDLDKVILKSAKGIALHRASDWVDDCYLMIGQSQHIKRDQETAEATFRYIQENLNPRKTQKARIKKLSDKEKKKVKVKKKKEKEKAAKSKKKEYAKKKKAKSKARKEAIKAKKKSASKSKSGKKSSSSKKSSGDKKAAADAAPTPATPPPSPSKPPKKEESKPDAPPKPEKPVIGGDPYHKGLGRTSAYPLAMVWLGRTLTARDKFMEAEFLFRELREDYYFPAEYKDDLALAEADLFIKLKYYDRAIEPLKEAVKLTRRKKERARLNYILAQLYERSNQYEQAYAAYERVIGGSPNYEMEINARLRQIQNGWSAGKISSADANKSLERMLREEKNADYRDQLYFTQAEIALHDGQKTEGIALLRKSLDANKNNPLLRADALFKLAELNFDREDFVQARNYFDSTLSVMPPADPRYPLAKNYAENLKEIARLIELIAANDSIVRIYNMSESERLALAKSIKKKREEELALKNAQDAEIGDGKPQAPLAGARPSNFYFYNETFLKKGKKDFVKTWGTRKLEDNWRRSSRPLAGVSEQTGDPSAGVNASADELSELEISELFKSIPSNEAELGLLRASTYDAMYQLGVLYREKLQHNLRCSGTLEEMMSRYPEIDKNEKEAWYYCYLAFTELKNTPKAQYYYDKLVGKYPNSIFARAISDPNFANSTKEREREINAYYADTYSLFQKGEYRSAFDKCQDAPRRFGATNPLLPKFILLSAMCTGNIEGQEAYCKALADLILRYPDSPESTRAKEIARLLSCKGFEVDDAKKKTELAPGAFEEAFTLDDDKLHYFLIALSGDVRLDDVKVAVSDYNREYHRLEQLRISNIFLGSDTNSPILVIRKFDSRDQAMRYYDEVKGRDEFLGESARKKYTKEYFVITQENYRRILKNRTLDGYREFFTDNYLK